VAQCIVELHSGVHIDVEDPAIPHHHHRAVHPVPRVLGVEDDDLTRASDTLSSAKGFDLVLDTKGGLH
jgi:hypothetical protein